MITETIFNRLELMVGGDVLKALRETKVAIFGLGGVGSWCAESLVRSGVGKLLIVDSDKVCITNVNRQLPATTATVGEVKVDVLAKRLREINPQVEIDARAEIYCKETAGTFGLEGYDYVIDAIDSLTEKADLIRHVLSIDGVKLFSSMGAALKMDSFSIRSSEFRKVEGDGLARALRQKLKKTGGMPGKKFMCVWSPEKRENRSGNDYCGSGENFGGSGENCGDGNENCAVTGQTDLQQDMWSARKARINGTVAHTTAIFGFALAGLVVSDVESSVLPENGIR